MTVIAQTPAGPATGKAMKIAGRTLSGLFIAFMIFDVAIGGLWLRDAELRRLLPIRR